MRLVVLAPILLLAVAVAIFGRPANVQVGATAPDGELSAAQLTCKTVGPLIGCMLISPHELDEDEGVQFIISIGGEAQTIVATRETNVVFRSSASCGGSDAHCYVFSFSPANQGSDFTISEVTPIGMGQAPSTLTDASPPSHAAQPQPLAPSQEPTPPDQPDQTAAVVAQTTPEQVEVETTDDALVETTDDALVETADDALVEMPQLSPEEIARRQREYEELMAQAKRDQDEVNAEIRRRQDEGDWPERDPDTPEDQLSDAELEAMLAVHEEMHRQRQERKAAEQQAQ